MQRDEDEDAAWRSIVDNYGDRPDLDPEAGPDQTADTPAVEPLQPLETFVPIEQPVEDPEWFTAPMAEPEERYVPPPPPPLPRPSRDRLLAWIGVFGSPTVLLVCLLARIGLPSLLAYALVAGFVGGFAYLVWQMPRGPRDPWDDGAQV